MNALISNMRIAVLAGVVAVAGACSPPPAEQNAGAPAAASDPAPATGPKPGGGMVMQTVIVIADSGSTNTIGYRISVGAAQRLMSAAMGRDARRLPPTSTRS